MKPRKAWVFPNETGSWCVGWYEPDGRRRKKSFGTSKKAANNWAAKKTGELVQGISEGPPARSWSEFIADFREQKLGNLSPSSVEAYNIAIAHYERLCSPKKASDITEASVDRFVAKRLKERGKKPNSTTSPATVNKGLRLLKRVFRVAKQWDLIPQVPQIEFVREPQVGPTYITPEQFTLLYSACDAATRPDVGGINTGDWWRAFLVFIFMTGWRVSEPLRLVWEDVDLEAATAITRAKDNKGRREARVPLHPIVIEHLERIQGSSLEVFPWPLDIKQLWPEFAKIQNQAGIEKVCRKDHAHNEACKRFGFHDLRRGFATANAGSLSASQLQTMMRHQSYTTTQRYIEMGHQMSGVTDKLAAPELQR